jgi:hypothetical protein
MNKSGLSLNKDCYTDAKLTEDDELKAVANLQDTLLCLRPPQQWTETDERLRSWRSRKVRWV